MKLDTSLQRGEGQLCHDIKQVDEHALFYSLVRPFDDDRRFPDVGFCLPAVVVFLTLLPALALSCDFVPPVFVGDPDVFFVLLRQKL